MGTRSTIEIEGIEFAKVYKQWDGYPEHMMQWLKDFNESFAKNRGSDAEYKFAQLLRFSAIHGDKYNLDSSDHTGWGVVPFNTDMGEEYIYRLHQDGTVTYKW